MAYAPVAEDFERRFENFGIVRGDLQKIHGFIERGIRVQIGAEGAADRLQVVDDLLFCETLGTVESHVLHKVGETALILLFKHGAGFHD